MVSDQHFDTLHLACPLQGASRLFQADQAQGFYQL